MPEPRNDVIIIGGRWSGQPAERRSRWPVARCLAVRRPSTALSPCACRSLTIAVHGLTDFGGDDALPPYQSLERTSGRGGHGTLGPFAIHQLGDDEISVQQRAFAASALAAGFPASAGFNTPDPLGVGPSVMATGCPTMMLAERFARLVR